MDSHNRTKGIVQTLHDEDWAKRADAILGLSKEEVAEASLSLLDCLQDEAWPVRANAALALGYVGVKSAIPSLLMLLQDPEWPVRRNAVIALGAIKDMGIFPPPVAQGDGWQHKRSPQNMIARSSKTVGVVGNSSVSS